VNDDLRERREDGTLKLARPRLRAEAHVTTGQSGCSRRKSKHSRRNTVALGRGSSVTRDQNREEVESERRRRGYRDSREQRKRLVVLVLLIVVVAALVALGATFWIFLAVALAATAISFFAWPGRRWTRRHRRRTKR
jgi:Flp pilus assembly protein TadB